MKNFICPYTGASYGLQLYKEYQFISSLSYEQAQELLNTILEKKYSINKLYKDNKSCFVANINTDNHSNIIYKIPKDRNNRKWQRFLTIFRPNEAFRTYASMMSLLSVGLKTPMPLIAAHKKEKGMTVESFFVYEFVEGQPGGKADVPIIFEAMKSLHQAGFTRSDPKTINFIVNNNEVHFIDYRLKKPKFFSQFQFTLNLCRFLHMAVSRKKEELEYYGRNIKYFSQAHYFLRAKSKLRKLRRGLGGNLSKMKNQS